MEAKDLARTGSPQYWLRGEGYVAITDSVISKVLLAEQGNKGLKHLQV